MGELEDWIERKKMPVNMRTLQPTKTNISVRVDTLPYGILTELAQQMGMTRSGLAEQILELALNDAYTKWHGRPVTEADKKRLLAVRSQKQLSVASAALSSNGPSNLIEMMNPGNDLLGLANSGKLVSPSLTSAENSINGKLLDPRANTLSVGKK